MVKSESSTPKSVYTILRFNHNRTALLYCKRFLTIAFVHKFVPRFLIRFRSHLIVRITEKRILLVSALRNNYKTYIFQIFLLPVPVLVYLRTNCVKPTYKKGSRQLTNRLINANQSTINTL